MADKILLVYKTPSGTYIEKEVNSPVTRRDIINLFGLDSTSTVFANGAVMGDNDTLTQASNVISSVVQAKGRA